VTTPNPTTNIIARQQLDNVAALLNGKWYQVEVIDSYGKRTTRLIVEYTPEE
tara:strand:- start:1221 stop:1376 length:156 start_codon:yes stop_codon:yes gene_type:complete